MDGYLQTVDVPIITYSIHNLRLYHQRSLTNRVCFAGLIKNVERQTCHTVTRCDGDGTSEYTGRQQRSLATGCTITSDECSARILSGINLHIQSTLTPPVSNRRPFIPDGGVFKFTGLVV